MIHFRESGSVIIIPKGRGRQGRLSAAARADIDRGLKGKRDENILATAVTRRLLNFMFLNKNPCATFDFLFARETY